MDTHGSCDDGLFPTIEAAAKQALHDWGRPIGDLEDLIQDLWLFYFEPRNRSVRKFVESRTTETGRRRVFYRVEKGDDGKHKRAGIANQILKEQQMANDLFQGGELYSTEAVKSWLRGTSKNKYLGKLIQIGLDILEIKSPSHREAIRNNYERGIKPSGKDGAGWMVLSRAVKSLTEDVNAVAKAEKQGEAVEPPSRTASGPRRASGHSDPTADMAIGLMNGGDNVIELHDGSTTTYRKEFEDADNIFATRYDRPSPPWAGIDLFEGELNDRTDMYRAQVFPELYPNEKPMLIENWPLEDKQAYCGGEYTEGYRRLKVVK